MEQQWGEGVAEGAFEGVSRRDFLLGAAAAGSVALAAAAAGEPAFAADDQLVVGVPDGEVMAPSTMGATYAMPSVVPLEQRAAEAKRILVVVDYQNDFVDGGVFGHIEPAIAIEDALYDSIKEYQDRGDIVIYTMDTHPADSYDLTREGQFNPPHCIPGTPGWEIHGKVAELLTPEKATRLLKGTYGCADLPKAIQMIRDQGTAIESVEIAGVSTTCRVLHNVILLYNNFPDLMLIMDSRTTASYTDEATVEQLKELEGWGVCVKW